MRAIYDGPHRLQINVPAPVGDAVRVTDFVTKLRTFAANFANSCHLKETPGEKSGRAQAHVDRNL